MMMNFHLKYLKCLRHLMVLARSLKLIAHSFSIPPKESFRTKEGERTAKTSPARVEVVPKTEGKQIKISIHEGRNRQVRKMLESVGLFVRKLKRIEYGGLNLKGLKPGAWRYLSEGEIRKLKSVSN